MRQLAIKVRARTGRETLSLGLMVARRYFLTLLAAVLPGWALSVALAALLWWLVGGTYAPLWAAAAVWWLKPLYERPALLRLSRLVFHEAGDWRREQKSAWARGWLAELTVLRFFRSDAPIRHALHLLEGVRGREYRERKRFFSAVEGGLAALFLLALLEGGVMYMALMLLPDVSPTYGNAAVLLAGGDEAALAAQLQALLAVFALLYFPLAAVSAVFYVSIGFMRYLNRRIISEGWAIALDLQALAARLPALCAAVLLAFFALHQPPALAIDAAQSAADKAWVEARVNDAQNGPYAMRKVRKGAARDGAEMAPAPRGFAELTRIVLIAGGAGVLLFLIVNVATHGRALRVMVRGKAPDAAQLSYQAAAEAQSCAAALHYWQAGQMVAALAVLYGRMVAAPERHRLPEFLRGESESEYLQRAAAQIGGGQRDFLRDFFALWQRTVYAHQPPERAAVHALIMRYQALWQA